MMVLEAFAYSTDSPVSSLKDLVGYTFAYCSLSTDSPLPAIIPSVLTEMNLLTGIFVCWARIWNFLGF